MMECKIGTWVPDNTVEMPQNLQTSFQRQMNKYLVFINVILFCFVLVMYSTVQSNLNTADYIST